MHIYLGTNTSLEDLLKIEEATDRISLRPEALPVTDLQIADQVFQWRKFTSELAHEEAHVKELVRVIETSEKPLDPILVTVVGDSYYVVDGHHRVLAYRAAKWSSPVPVVYFEGSVDEARLEGLRLNIKNKLPMTRDDKFEAAWSLVKEGRKYSKSQIIDMTTASDGTVATMRRILKEYPESINMSWYEARSRQHESSEDFDHDDWLEQKAHKMAEQIMKNVGPDLPRRPDVLALALEKIDASIPKALVQEWPELVREIQEEWDNSIF